MTSSLAAMPAWGCTVLGTAMLLAIGLAVLDRVACWAESRGWIYWRKKRPQGGGGATAGLLTGFQKIVEPQIEHRIQVMEERHESMGQRMGRGDDIDPSPPADPPAPRDAGHKS